MATFANGANGATIRAALAPLLASLIAPGEAGPSVYAKVNALVSHPNATFGDVRAKLNALLTPTASVAGKLVQIGDSIGASYPNAESTGVIHQLGYGSAVTIDNDMSIGGHTVGHAAADGNAGIAPDLVALATARGALTDSYRIFYDPTQLVHIHFQRGTNDFTIDGLTDTQLLAKVQAEVTAAKAAGLQTSVGTILPRVVGFAGWTSTMEGYRIAYNQAVRAGQTGAHYVMDVASIPVLQDPTNTTYFADGLHLTPTGQLALVTVWRGVLDIALANARKVPTLATVAFSGTLTAGSASTGTLLHTTNGSTLAAVMAGLTINSTARTYGYNGAGSAGAVASALTETLAGATGSPKSSGATIAAASSAPLTLSSAAFSTNNSGKFGNYMTAGTGTVPASIVTSNPITLPLTIEMWVNTTATGLQVAIGQKSSGHAWYFGTNSGKPIASSGNAEAATSTDIAPSGAAAINDGNWHHLALVLTSSGTWFGCDGVMIGQTSVVATCATANTLATLRNLAGGYAWTGGTDELVFTQGAKYSGSTYTVPTSAPAAAGALACYPLDADGTAATS